jgi:hypothetical protein
MLDKLLLQKRLSFLLIILFVSLAMSLFLPAMVTLYIFYPILVISYLAYLVTKQESKTTIALLTFSIILGTVFTLGIPWIISFMLFIHVFPTYVVALIALIIMTLLPLKKYSIVMKIFIFILLSTLIGLNTNLLFLGKSIMGQDRKVNETFSKKLSVTNKEFIEIKSNSQNIPIVYNKFDFISFGSNEGCMCGYWVFPRLSKFTIAPYILGKKEIPFSWIKSSDKKIIIDYKEIQGLYNLNIKIFQKNELLSSLTIKDYLPFQGAKITNRDKSLNNFDYRLEYLLRHNIWNAILYYLGAGQADNKKVISDFLDKSIDTNIIDKDWTESTIKTTSSLVYNSNISLCTSKKDDNYKHYTFNNWNSKEKDYSIKLGSNPDRFIFNDNNITYTTLSHSDEFVWHNNISIYKTAEYFFVLKTSFKPFRVILWEFDRRGNFLKEVHIKLPKKAKIDGRDWHPISHIEIINNKMSFRVNNIYEHKNKKNECSYSKIEVEI